MPVWMYTEGGTCLWGIEEAQGVELMLQGALGHHDGRGVRPVQAVDAVYPQHPLCTCSNSLWTPP